MGHLHANGSTRRLNWKRQPKDPRDLTLHHLHPKMKVLPVRGSTVAIADPAIRDQGQIGSCTQNAGAANHAFIYMVEKKVSTDPLFSRLFGYWITRKLEGTPETEDSGCNVRDVFKAYKKFGLCYEGTWPYLDFTKQPDIAAFTEALNHKALTYLACDTVDSMKQSIAQGFPMIFGFDCFTSLESEETAKTGVIPLPGPDEQSIGGHCMFIDGYDDALGMFTGHNSWGTGWGVGGRFSIPYGYWEKGLASDATTLRTEAV